MEDFSFLQFTRSDLMTVHQAVLSQWLIEERLRSAHGLEGTDPPLLLGRIESLLPLSPDEAHSLFHTVDDLLWEHTWLNYSEEWAWQRADEDVRKELGARVKYMNDEQLEALIGNRSEAMFETYCKEISLDRSERITKKTKKMRK